MPRFFSKDTLFFALALAFLNQQAKAERQIFNCSDKPLEQLCKTQNSRTVCALDDDDQYLTIKSACQACGYEDTISYTFGQCQCPQVPCPNDHSCIAGKCVDFQNMTSAQLAVVAKQLISQQKHQQALKILQEVLSQDETNDYNYYLASLATFGTQKFKQSLKYIKKAILIDPEVPGYYIIRGRAFAEDKQPQQAQKQYQKVLSMGFDDIGLISFYQAQNLLKNQKNQQSIKKFQQALKYHPEKTQWYIRKAMAHAINKQQKMALLTCRQGLKIDPDNEQIKIFMKQFVNIDQGKQSDLERVRQGNAAMGQSSPKRDMQEVNKMLLQRQQQEALAFDLKRIEQKKKKKQEKQLKESQKTESNQEQEAQQEEQQIQL